MNLIKPAPVSSAEAPPVVLEYLGFLLEILPPTVARKRAEEMTGGMVSAGALANADSRGTGPRVRYRVGRDTVYPTIYLLEWLEKKGVTPYVRE